MLRQWVRSDVLLICAAILLCWGGVLMGSFQYDDYPNILMDPATYRGAVLVERLLTGVRPLARLSYAWDHWLWQRTAGGWLLTNLLLHGVTTFGVWKLMRLRGVTDLAALLAALAFALQPANAMTVAYVTGRSTGLMTALLVMSLLALEWHFRSARVRHLMLSLLAFVAAVASKEIALVFPLLLALWLWSRDQSPATNRPAPERQVRTIMLAFALVALLCALAAFFNPRYRGLLAFSLDLRDPLDSLVLNAAALPATLSLLLRPWALSVEHAAQFSALDSVLGAAVLLAWCGTAIRFGRSRPWLALGMLWPVLALMPSHSWIAKSDPIAESSLYFAWLGPAMSLGVMAARLMESLRARAVVFACMAILAALCLWRTMVWSDPIRLWQEATLHAPQSARAWNNLGMAYLAQDQPAQARTAFASALKVDPGNARAMHNLDLLDITNR